MKKFYEENRVFSILMIIVLVCLLIIAGLGVRYIFNSNTKSVYGNRLDGIGDVKIDKDMKETMTSKVKEMEKVDNVVINIHGKIVYFDITFNDEITVEEAKNTAIKCLELFEEDYVNYYDIQFLMVNEEFVKNQSAESTAEKTNIFPIMGYKKAGEANISWSHNAG